MAAQICETCKHKKDRCYCSPNSTCDKYEKQEMINKRTWEEFRNSGMLWWINMILHTFGWAIVATIDNGVITNVYPARVRFRGFDDSANTNGYIKLSKYMKENASDLIEESES